MKYYIFIKKMLFFWILPFIIKNLFLNVAYFLDFDIIIYERAVTYEKEIPY